MNVNNIIVTGKSGAGKQPRIDVLVNEFGLTQLSTGNIFRSYLSAYKSLGLTLDLESFFDAEKNDFVEDSIIEKAIKSTCDEKGVDVQDGIWG